MNKRYHKLVALLCGVVVLVSCQNTTPLVRSSNSIIPTYIHDPEERLQYLIEHYWDNVNLKDSVWLIQRKELRYKFDDYFSLLASGSNIQRGQLLRPLASLDGEVLKDALGYYKDYYQSEPITAEKDVFYSHVLLWSIRSPKVPATLQQEAKEQLKHILKNRVGSLAADFEYKSDSLSLSLSGGRKAEYRLLLLNPNGTAEDSLIYEHLRSKVIYKQLADKKALRTTMIYLGASAVKPDSLCPQWLERGIDPIDTIRRYALYDIDNRLSIYLLNKDRQVLLKNPKWEELTKYLEDYEKR